MIPLVIVLLLYNSRGHQKRAQALLSIPIERLVSVLQVLLLSLLEKRQDDGVGTLAKQLDLAFGRSHNNTHPFPIRGELYHIQ